MQQKSLLQLLPPQEESDYVEHFQALAAVNVEIRQRGPTAERLLRKSILEMDVGNFAACVDSARDAAEVRPRFAEAHYQQGMGLLLLAFTRAGVMAGAPAMEQPVGSTRTIMQHAARALRNALDINGSDDEVAEDVAVLEAFIGRYESDHELETALQRLAVQ